jgi:type 2 lantibiotic biosynthesis protein LanM
MDTINRVFATHDRFPALWPLVAAERQALESIDIPRFVMSAGDTEFITEGGARIRGHFARSGAASVRDRVNRLSEEDLGIQLALLGRALTQTPTSRFEATMPKASPSTDTDDDRLRRFARWIGEEMLQRGRWTGGGSLVWDAAPWQQLAARDSIADLDLYQGNGGAALFLAALYRVEGEGRWKDAALAGMQPLLTAVRADDRRLRQAELGGCDGLGSVAWVLARAAKLIGEPKLLESAVRLVDTVSVERITTDRRFDIVSGAAGLICGLLAVHAQEPGADALAAARAAGEHLVKHAVRPRDDTAAWPVNGALLAGFAHGAAGIGCALARLFEATGEARFLDVTAAAYRFERSLFSPSRANWRIASAAAARDLREPEWMTAWCHGAPGIALARILSLESWRDDDVVEDIEAALQTTAATPFSQRDHVCCGSLGRADVLATAGLLLGRAGLTTDAVAIAQRVCNRAASNGRFSLPSTDFECRVFMPGFFHGLAGIGYQLLRITEPDSLPSVLGLQP